MPRRNCYLDLRLQSSSPHPYRSMQAIWTLSFQYFRYDSLHLYISGIKQVGFFLHFCRNRTLNIHNKLVAILHNGRQCIFDTAELQARVIIWLASREMEGSTGLHSETLLIHVSRGLSIKKSLQNFLQRRIRKKRSQPHLPCNPK
ncbi:Protein TIFY 5A [Glycine soja]